MKRDLKAVGIYDGSWYSAAQDRGKWREAWSQGVRVSISKNRRQGD